MTHLFDCSTNEFNQLSSGSKRFDILKFNRPISVGDTVIYQRMADTEEQVFMDGEINETPFTEDELSLTIDYIFYDEVESLKKGFVAVGFGFIQQQTA